MQFLRHFSRRGAAAGAVAAALAVAVAVARAATQTHLVENCVLDGGEIEGAAANVVENAARRSDDNVHAATQVAHLRAHRRAAVDLRAA